MSLQGYPAESVQISEVLRKVSAIIKEHGRMEDDMRLAKSLIQDLRERLITANIQKNKLISLYKTSVQNHNKEVEEKNEMINKYTRTIRDLEGEIEQLKKKVEKKNQQNSFDTHLKHPVFETQSIGKIIKSKICNRFSSLDIKQGHEKKNKRKMKKKLYKDNDSIADLENES